MAACAGSRKEPSEVIFHGGETLRAKNGSRIRRDTGLGQCRKCGGLFKLVRSDGTVFSHSPAAKPVSRAEIQRRYGDLVRDPDPQFSTTPLVELNAYCQLAHWAHREGRGYVTVESANADLHVIDQFVISGSLASIRSLAVQLIALLPEDPLG
jgi:hypothetical protein